LNHERILKLASVVEEHPEKFHIANWFEGPEVQFVMHDGNSGTFDVLDKVNSLDFFSEHCGTTGCFAGQAIVLWPADVADNDSFSSAGARILGLTEDQAIDLFYNQIENIETAEDGVAHLRNMVEEDMRNNGF
jgi:hypothetical protein